MMIRRPDLHDNYEVHVTPRASPCLASVQSALAVSVLVGLLSSACATAPLREPQPEESSAPAWSAAIVPDDRERLRTLPQAWSTALAQARAEGYGDRIRALGALADPAATLPDPEPPPGRYRCRTVKLGSPGDLLAFVAYGWFECDIVEAGGELRLEKLTGSQRQHGTLYPDTNRRLVFLGTLAIGSNETTPPAYGAERERNVVGVLERVGPARWRLVQPWPHFESVLDLLELEPR